MRTTWILALLAITACTAGSDDKDTDTDTNVDTDDTDNGTEDLFGCLPDTLETLTDLSAIPDGLAASPSDLIATLTGTFAGDLTLEAGGTQATTFTVTQSGDVVLERRSWHDDGDAAELDTDVETDLAGDTDPEDGCPDTIRFSGSATLTADTVLTETLEITLVADANEEAFASSSLDFDDLVGSASPIGFDPAEMAETLFQLDAHMAGADSWALDLGFMGESEPSGTGDDATVSATFEAWASGTLTRVTE